MSEENHPEVSRGVLFIDHGAPPSRYVARFRELKVPADIDDATEARFVSKFVIDAAYPENDPEAASIDVTLITLTEIYDAMSLPERMILDDPGAGADAYLV